MVATSLLLAAVVNISGVVTFEREGLPFYFMTDTDGENWRVERQETDTDIKVGDWVAVSGEREPSIKRRVIEPTIEKIECPLPSEVASELGCPIELTIPDVFAAIMPYGDTPLYGAMITSEGLLRDINRRQTTTQLLVGDGDCNLQVEIPIPVEDALPADLVQGATVRVTGVLVFTSIENYEEGIFGRIENIELLPLSEDAVEVICRVPFWTRRRLIAFTSGLAILCLAVAAWAITLRRMVARRSRELSESIRLRETARIEADASRRERLRLAADLHDGFQQYLAGAMFRLKAAMNYLPKDATNSRVQLENVRDALQHTQNGLRSMLWAINEESEGPESLMELFGFAARRMAHWDGIVDIACEGAERKVARKAAASLLLIMQEAVGNAIRHGKAEHVRVRLAFEKHGLQMSVIDDGTGFDAETCVSAGHYGMNTMERRAASLGGSMSVWSKGGLGSKLTFTIPFPAVQSKI